MLRRLRHCRVPGSDAGCIPCCGDFVYSAQRRLVVRAIKVIERTSTLADRKSALSIALVT